MNQAKICSNNSQSLPSSLFRPCCSTWQWLSQCVLFKVAEPALNLHPRYGWDSTEYVGFNLYGYEWLGVISCRDNPTTYDWEYDTVKGNAPTSVVRSFAEGYCEGRLYG